jgi:phospholipid/cholesterol/gamma-HCH transport system substrate-binding protein
MDKDKKTEFKVGLVVLLGISILIFGILWGKEYKLTAEQYELKIIFRNSGGLEVGDPVTVAGVRKGKVSGVQLKDGRILVTMKIDKDVRLFSDTEVLIENAAIMGGMKVSVDPGISGVDLNISQELTGKTAPSITETAHIISEIVNEVRRITQNLNTTINIINATIGNPEVKNSLKEAVINFEKASVGFEKASVEFERTSKGIGAFAEKNMKELDVSVGNVKSATSDFKTASSDFKLASSDFKLISTDLKVMSSELKKLASDPNLKITIDQTKKVVMEIDSLSVSLRKITAKIEKSEGTLGKFINEKDLYNELRRTTSHLDSLIMEIRTKGVKTKLF